MKWIIIYSTKTDHHKYNKYLAKYKPWEVYDCTTNVHESIENKNHILQDLEHVLGEKTTYETYLYRYEFIKEERKIDHHR